MLSRVAALDVLRVRPVDARKAAVQHHQPTNADEDEAEDAGECYPACDCHTGTITPVGVNQRALKACVCVCGGHTGRRVKSSKSSSGSNRRAADVRECVSVICVCVLRGV